MLAGGVVRTGTRKGGVHLDEMRIQALGKSEMNESMSECTLWISQRFILGVIDLGSRGSILLLEKSGVRDTKLIFLA
jgi:hypothetical protein